MRRGLRGVPVQDGGSAGGSHICPWGGLSPGHLQPCLRGSGQNRGTWTACRPRSTAVARPREPGVGLARRTAHRRPRSSAERHRPRLEPDPGDLQVPPRLRFAKGTPRSCPVRKTQPCTASRGRHRVAVTWSTRPDALLVHEASWSDSSRARSAPLGAPGVGRSLCAVSRGAGNATSASPARGGSGPHGGATCPQAEPARPHSEDSLSKPTGLRATPGGRAPGPATDLRTPGPVPPAPAAQRSPPGCGRLHPAPRGRPGRAPTGSRAGGRALRGRAGDGAPGTRPSCQGRTLPVARGQRLTAVSSRAKGQKPHGATRAESRLSPR